VTTHFLLNISSAILIGVTIVMIVATLRTRVRVLQRYKAIEWSQQQIARALELCASNNIDDIINGLQTVRALGVADEQLLNRVGQLLEHSDARVVEYAQDALLALSRRGSITAVPKQANS
jgi:hypothetical protein